MWLKHVCKCREDVEKDLKEDGVRRGGGGGGGAGVGGGLKNKPHLKASHD